MSKEQSGSIVAAAKKLCSGSLLLNRGHFYPRHTKSNFWGICIFCITRAGITHWLHHSLGLCGLRL